MIIITYRPLYCVFALKLGIPSRKFLAPPVYGMHRAGRQEYEATSLSTYSDNMNLRYGVPVIQQNSMK